MPQLRRALLPLFAFTLIAGCKPKDIPATGLTNPDGTTSACRCAQELHDKTQEAGTVG